MKKTLCTLILILTVIQLVSCQDLLTTSKTNTSLETLNKIDSLVKLYEEYGEFNGAILVAENGKLVYQNGLGKANMEWDIPNSSTTKFRVGSITKQFTAMLILQLVEEQKLALHEPIIKYLPDYPTDKAAVITLHHLLTHSSGIPDRHDMPAKTKDIPSMNIPDNYSPENIVAAFSDLPLEFKPGEKFKYSNAGYSLLGYIIEVTTGKTYAENLDERIFKPLSMLNSGVERHRPITTNRASGYFKTWGEYKNANYTDMSNAYSAGAIYSTVEDLFLWDKALYTDQILSKKYRSLMFEKHIEDPGYNGYYGYGWSIVNHRIGNTDKRIPAYFHDGVIDGFCAMITRIPSTQSTIILLSNVRRAPLNEINRNVLAILTDNTFDFPKQSLAYTIVDVIEEAGINAGKQFFENNKESEAYFLREDEMNIASYKFLQKDKAQEAKVVLELALEKFPKAFNLYDSYAEVLSNLGETEKAVENYKRSIELNPKNENAFQMLEKLDVNTKPIRDLYSGFLKADSTWGQELFYFPIHFAPEIDYKGMEEALFMKGWSDIESDGFWTYIFAWRVETKKMIKQVEIEQNLKLYFDGLMEGVNKEKGRKLPDTETNLTKVKSVKNIDYYSGKITVHDSFTTREKLTLNVTIENHFSKENNESKLIFRYSPKSMKHKVWLDLNEVKL